MFSRKHMFAQRKQRFSDGKLQFIENIGIPRKTYVFRENICFQTENICFLENMGFLKILGLLILRTYDLAPFNSPTKNPFTLGAGLHPVCEWAYRGFYC